MFRLTITLPIGRPSCSSSSMASMVSWMGSASSSVTRWMAVCSECSSRTTPSACECTGPPLARSETALVTSRKRAIRPVGGESTTIASYAGFLLRSRRTTDSLILPVSSTSRRPGAIVVANSMAPIRRIARPAMPRL